MARVHIDELSRPEIEHAEEYRHEHHLVVALAKAVIGVRHDLGEIAVTFRRHREVLQHRLRHDHEERGGDALARHVRHRDCETILVQHIEIIEVAADFLRGRHTRVELEGQLPRKIRRHAGKHPRLDFLRDGKLGGDTLFFRRCPRQVLHIFLEIALHGVHAVRQMLDLVAGLDLEFLVEIAVGDFLDAFRQGKDRTYEMIGRFRSHQKDQPQKDEQQRNAAHRKLHEDAPKIGREFLHLTAQAVPCVLGRIVDLRLPDDLPEAPAQRLHRRIGEIDFLSVHRHKLDVALARRHRRRFEGETAFRTLPEIAFFLADGQRPFLFGGEQDFPVPV